MKKFVRWFTLSLLIVSGRSAIAQDVLTQHNDLARTGWNQNETVLNTNNVNSNTFGLAYKLSVDDQIYAQPLVVNGVNIPGHGIKNIVYLATVNNTIYAFDADVAGAPYWTLNYTNTPLAGSRPPHAFTAPYDMHPSLCAGYYFDLVGNMGIVGTPVIDKPNGIMYFVTKIVNGTPDNHDWSPNVPLDEYSYGSAEFHQYLHAIDITNGAEKAGSPVEITATATGTGDGQTPAGSGMLNFDPRRNFNRSGLALSNGIVYIAFAAHCDFNPSHGWLLGYNATTLTRGPVYITTPNDGRGGIWMSGSGPAIDANGSIYFTTGNSLDEKPSPGIGQGTQYIIYNSDPANAANRGESVIKLTPNTQDNTATTFTLSSYFTPFNYMELNELDLDFPIQTILIPNTNMVITGCKDDSLYVMDRTNLGGYDPFQNRVLQTKYLGTDQGTMHSSFAYFGGTTPLLYQFSENTDLQAFPVLSNSLGTPTVNTMLQGPVGPSGGYMSVSSNGMDPLTGILWVSHSITGCSANTGTCGNVLRALKASDITQELWNSYINKATDSAGLFSKMVCPTVANGKVYLPTASNVLAVYGLKTNTTCVTNVALGKSATASSQNGSASNVTDGNPGTSWTSNSSDNQSIYVDMGSRYDFCRVMINWQNTNALNFIIEVSEDATTWTSVDSVVNNTSTTTDFFGSFTGRYVRMRGKNRAGAGGYSINEFQIFGQPASSCAAPSGLTVPNPTTTSAVLNWNPVSGAVQYLVQYKPRAISSWISRAVTTNSISLTALSCGTTYDYSVQTICGGSVQSTTSSGGFISASCGTSGCGLLTRYFNSDIGDIGVGGSVCLSGGIYTIKGSGTDIGGTDDQFQYVFTSTPGDEQAATQVLNQDQVSSSDKAGIMIRDSLTNTSRFAYMASVNGGTSVVFIYRSVPGGPTTTIPIAGNVSFPYWIKVAKMGTQFAPFTSADGVTWAQASPAVNLNFGTDINNAPKYGMAVTSANNTLLSTAQLGSFGLTTNSTPLPIQLASFTAQNINNDHVLVSWSTSMEEHVDHFEVQKSADGSFYQTFTKVNAAGNSQTLLNYSVQDNQPQLGINYYRLEEVDSDGKTFFSPVVTVEFGKSAAPVLQPNPATTYTNAVSASEPIIEITLYDILGKELRKIRNSSAATTVRINTATLETGVYIVRIKTAGKIYEQKLFKQ
ncbi:MAG: discoidin domain-containing protein [Chitinophagales bacterium]